MSNSILYYPFIDVPNNDWLRTCILYYDKIGSIIPGRFGSAPGDLDELTTKLINRNMLCSLAPESVLGDAKDKTTAAAKQIIKAIDLLLDQSNQHAQEGDPGFLTSYCGELPESEWLRMSIPIHEHKLHIFKNMCKELKSRKLAWNCDSSQYHKFTGKSIHEVHDIQDTNGWLLVEPIVGSAFMHFLASLMADELEWTPMTDSALNLTPALQLNRSIDRSRSDSTFLQQYELQKRQYDSQVIRERILAKLLPIPEEASFDQLADFKQQHGDVLSKFRHAVEEAVVEIRNSSEESRDEMTTAKLNMLGDQKNTVIDAIRSKGFKSRVLNIGLWAADVATLGVTPIKAISGEELAGWDEFTFATALIGFGLLSLKEYQAHCAERKSSLSSPMAYSALFAG